MTEFTLDKLPRQVLEKIDFQTAFAASRCVIAAERMQLFRKLHGNKMTAAAIGRKIGISGWRLEVYLGVLVSLGLLKKKGRLFHNTRLTEKYFIRERSIYWTKLFSKECIKEYEAFSVLEEMLKTGRTYQSILGIKRKDYIREMKDNPQWAHDFTHMLYYDHQTEAEALAKYLDLKGYRRVLDLGGGSGVMSISLVRRNRHLKACILDIEAVIPVTRKIIRRERLNDRIETVVGNMKKFIPSGYDVVMLCDAGSYSVDLFQRIRDVLPPGGLIVLCEQFSTDDYTEPLNRLMWQLRSKKLWLVTINQAVANLRQCGFVAIRRRRIHPGMWVITGRKKKQNTD